MFINQQNTADQHRPSDYCERYIERWNYFRPSVRLFVRVFVCLSASN